MPKRPWTPVRRFFFFATGGLGLWLGAFGKVWLFRCQSGIRGFGLRLLIRLDFPSAKAALETRRSG